MAESDLSKYIGEMGVCQWQVFVAMFIIFIFSADSIQIIFTAGHMPHWCRVPELDDLPYDVQKNVAIPAESSADQDGSVEYSSCEVFSLNYSVYNRSQFYSWNRSLMISNDTSVVTCSLWTYDQSQFLSTIISKVNGMQNKPLLTMLQHGSERNLLICCLYYFHLFYLVLEVTFSIFQSFRPTYRLLR